MTQHNKLWAAILMLLMIPSLTVPSFGVNRLSSHPMQYAFIPKDSSKMALTVSSNGETLMTTEGEKVTFCKVNEMYASSTETHWIIALDSNQEYEFSLATPHSKWTILFFSSPSSPSEYASFTLPSNTSCTVQFDPEASQSRIKKAVLRSAEKRESMGAFSFYLSVSVYAGNPGYSMIEGNSQSRELMVQKKGAFYTLQGAHEVNSAFSYLSPLTLEKIILSSQQDNVSQRLVLFGDLTHLLSPYEPFHDVQSSDWFASMVAFAENNGWMYGVGDGHFAPHENMTRAMLVSTLYRMQGSPNTVFSSFDDIPEGSYYAKAVAWAKEHKIVMGYSDTIFAPNDQVTREQLVTMLDRFVDHLDAELPFDGNLLAFAYEDYDSVSKYAKPSMEWAVGSGLITGDEHNQLSPFAPATRAQVATVLFRLHQKLDSIA